MPGRAATRMRVALVEAHYRVVEIVEPGAEAGYAAAEAAASDMRSYTAGKIARDMREAAGGPALAQGIDLALRGHEHDVGLARPLEHHAAYLVGKRGGERA